MAGEVEHVPGVRVCRAASGSTARSRDTYPCTIFAAVAGARSPHSAVTSRSADTTLPASSASTASSARGCPAGSSTARPSATSSTGPNSRSSTVEAYDSSAPASTTAGRTYPASVKVEALEYGDRKVYTVSAFNRGVAPGSQRLPTVWVEGEVTELRRQARWQTVFFTLKDPETARASRRAMPRGQFDGLRLDLADGERVHVYGRPELWEQQATSACGRSRSSASASATTSRRSSG